MQQWQRQRHPDDVPTSVAVAVADFCRRAKGAAPSAVVREALAILGDEDDFRVKALADAEPEVRPLGPFAVVDLILGTEPAIAAQREQTGYYELVRSMAAQTEAPARKPAASLDSARDERRGWAAVREPTQEPEPTAKQKRQAKKAAATLAEKIAPKKRAPAAPKVIAAIAAAPAWKRRELPAPRGKFTRIEAEANRFDELKPAAAKDEVSSLIAAAGNRIALQKTLEQRYVVRRGVPPSLEDVEELIARHKLQKVLERHERTAIMSAVVQHRGALSRVARELGINNFELDRLIAAAGLRRDVDEQRERYVREALSTSNLSARLELLQNAKYLGDLKIVRRFKEALVRDLLELLEQLPVMSDLDTLTAAAARRHALDPEALRRAIDRLGIEGQLDFQPAI
jgi:hypothetical protein